MSNLVRKMSLSLSAALLAVSGLFSMVSADIAPDPVRRVVSYTPFLLILAVIVIVLVIIKVFFKK